MKKLLLLLISGSIVVTAGAQERRIGVTPVSSMSQEEQQLPANMVRTFDFDPRGTTPQSGRLIATGTANKTTTGGTRWYNYFPYMDTIAKLAAPANTMKGFNAATLMWQDTTQSGQFTSGLSHVNLASMGMIFDPSSIAYNDSNYYAGAIRVGSGDAFTIDSVSIIGYYNFNPAKTSVKDTIRLSFVTGMGTTAATDDIFSNYHVVGGHYDTKNFLDVNYDTILNYERHGTTWGTPSSNVQNIILNNSTTPPAWADTLTTGAVGAMVKTVALTTPLSVSANGFASMSISFKSGDPALLSPPASSLPGDTLFYATGANKYNFFRPFVSYVSDLTTAHTQQWPIYNTADSNVGIFGRIYNAGHIYSPTWLWSTSNGTAASSLQYPNISFHVTCATCAIITNTPPNSVNNVYTISKVNAYPNPANNELNIPFSLTESAAVTVSLSNMVGQVVASQDMGNVVSGKAVFNTSAIPAGVYIYTVLANGQRNTGRVVVAH